MLVVLIKSSLTHLFEDQDYGNNILCFRSILRLKQLYSYLLKKKQNWWISQTLTLWKNLIFLSGFSV